MVLSKGAKIEGIDADGSDRVDIDQCESDKLSRVGQYAHDLELRGNISALRPCIRVLVFGVSSLHYVRCASLHRVANAREQIMTKERFRRLLVDE
jgi:hypothetical protein